MIASPEGSLGSWEATSFDIFWLRPSPIETDLGENHTSGTRMSRFGRFRNRKLSAEASAKKS